ncbi:hypothetical protein PMAYCL1PPCAC_27056 [Pristionchus mayeri]|uniref:Uncharacterized protein n=1 Tax=Pristionchus mayeri TaxID=1317129 RepID=A0AAN5D5P8_9BILA|nr:hypothetical protein PMAYCL1PPCAC_27056 [Pristionchus mayeri]
MDRNRSSPSFSNCGVLLIKHSLRCTLASSRNYTTNRTTAQPSYPDQSSDRRRSGVSGVEEPVMSSFWWASRKLSSRFSSRRRR